MLLLMSDHLWYMLEQALCCTDMCPSTHFMLCNQLVKCTAIEVNLNYDVHNRSVDNAYRRVSNIDIYHI